jgi:hypothetical protein
MSRSPLPIYAALARASTVPFPKAPQPRWRSHDELESFANATGGDTRRQLLLPGEARILARGGCHRQECTCDVHVGPAFSPVAASSAETAVPSSRRSDGRSGHPARMLVPRSTSKNASDTFTVHATINPVKQWKSEMSGDSFAQIGPDLDELLRGGDVWMRINDPNAAVPT